MKKSFSALMVILCSVSMAFAGPEVFKQDSASDIKKFAKSALDLNLKKLKKLNVKKLVILECFGEYVISKEVSNSASSQRHTGWATSRTTSLDMGSDYYTNTSNLVYQAVKEAFESNGIGIVPIEELLANEKYVSFNLEEEKSGRGASSGMFKPTVVEKTQKVSVPGLGIFPSSPLKLIKLIINLGDITHAVGAEGFLQVKFKVDSGKNFKPVLKNFDVLLSADIREEEVGFKGNKKMRYDFMTQWAPVVKLEKEFITAEEVTETKKGPVVVEKYDKGLMEMLYAVTDGIRYGIGEVLSK